VVAGLNSDKHRLEVARGVGANSSLASAPSDMQAAVAAEMAKTGDGFGFDVVIDAAGVSATLQMAMQAVRPAGQIVKVGWGPQPIQFSLDPLVQKNVTLSGSFSHNWPIWERVISMIVSGQINLDSIISRVAPLPEWHDCFEKMEGGEYVKAVLTP
jgi:alcohol dehydrogenase/L-iditol 2-dehydrogenase